MTTLEKHSIEKPDEVRPFRGHGHMDVVTIGDFTFGRGVFEPGWSWAEDVKPIAGTTSCQARHTGVCLGGEMRIRSDDGAELVIKEGDVFVIEPGHEAWVNGEVPCVLYGPEDDGYAKPR
jgi:hypothetical protein